MENVNFFNNLKNQSKRKKRTNKIKSLAINAIKITRLKSLEEKDENEQYSITKFKNLVEKEKKIISEMIPKNLGKALIRVNAFKGN